MINRELRKVSLITYESGVDAYGQRRVGKNKSQSIEMIIKPYNHTAVEDPRYTEVELIGLTKDKISKDNRIEVDNKTYEITFIDNGRLNVAYLKKI